MHIFAEKERRTQLASCPNPPTATMPPRVRYVVRNETDRKSRGSVRLKFTYTEVCDLCQVDEAARDGGGGWERGRELTCVVSAVTRVTHGKAVSTDRLASASA